MLFFAPQIFNIYSPLDQFEIRDLFSLDLPILNYLHIPLTNIGLYLTIGSLVLSLIIVSLLLLPLYLLWWLPVPHSNPLISRGTRWVIPWGSPIPTGWRLVGPKGRYGVGPHGADSTPVWVIEKL
jgi:hypothetical protein